MERGDDVISSPGSSQAAVEAAAQRIGPLMSMIDEAKDEARIQVAGRHAHR